MFHKKTLSSFDGSTPPKRSGLRSDPIKLLVILLATIMIVEILVMVALSQFDMAHGMFVWLGLDLPDYQHIAFEAKRRTQFFESFRTS